MKDYYSILGVSKSASQDDIKSAYRKLAMKNHPDRNGGDDSQFKEINEAYDTLGNAQKRSEYDRPQQPPPFFSQSTAFDDLFGQRFNQRRKTQTQARIELWLELADLFNPGKSLVNINSRSGQRNVEIDIPPGIDDGDAILYSKLAPGDADLVVVYRIKPDPIWQKKNHNLHYTKKVNIWDLLTGTSFDLTLPNGDTVLVKVPELTNPGSSLRLRSKGLPSKIRNSVGDTIVRLESYIPDSVDPDLLDYIRQTKTK